MALIKSLSSIITGINDSENLNIFSKFTILKNEYKYINIKHYIKYLVISFEKQQNLNKIQSFIADSTDLSNLFPHLKAILNYFINLYKKKISIDEENNTNINLKWNCYDLSILNDTPSNKYKNYCGNTSNNNDTIGGEANISTRVSDKNYTIARDEDYEEQFRLKFELIRNNFDDILLELNQSNIPFHKLKRIVTFLHQLLYYILSSNRKTNVEIFLLHFCFCWNAYIEMNFNMASDLAKVTTYTNDSYENLEIVNIWDLSHLKNAITSLSSVLSTCDTSKYRPQYVERYYTLDCFLKFIKIIHSSHVIDIKKIDEITNFCSIYPDMNSICVFYRAYYYQSIGFVESAKILLNTIITSNKFILEQYSHSYSNNDLCTAYNTSIYNRKSVLSASLSLLLKLEAKCNNLYEMDKIVNSDILKRYIEGKNINDDNVRFIYHLNGLLQADLSGDIIKYQQYLLNMSKYYHDSHEILKNYYYRYTLLMDDSMHILHDLKDSFNFLYENFPNTNENSEFTLSFGTIDTLICNAIIYVKILKRIGRYFEAIQVLSICVQKCVEINFNKYLVVFSKLMISLLNIKGKNCVAKKIQKSIEKFSSIYCGHI